MEENFIYDDIGTEGDLGTLISDLQTRNDVLQEHVSSLEKDIKKLCDKISDMQKIQDNLSKNISELFNTAKNELSRKDRRIAELQSKLDEMIFRRSAPHTGFKRKWEEPHIEENNKKTRSESAVGPQFERTTDNHSCSDSKSTYKGREGMCQSNNEKMDLESSYRCNSQRENDSGRRVQSRGNSRERREFQRDKRDLPRERGECQRDRENCQSDRRKSQSDRGNSHCDKGGSQRDRGDSQRERDRRDSQRDTRDSQRDTRESHRDRKETYRDNNRDWGGHKENAADRRETRKDNRESRKDTFDNNKSYRERSRGRSRDVRTSYRDLKVEHGEHRDNRRSSRDRPADNRDRGPNQYRDESREISKLRNEKHGDIVCMDDQQDDQPPRSKPVLSGDRSRSGTFLDTMKIQDNSREEGEVSDEDVKKQYTVVNEVPKKPINFGRNLPFDDSKAFNVHKFIQKQGKMHKGQKAMRNNSTNEENDDQNNQVEGITMTNTVRVDVNTVEQISKDEVPEKVIKVDTDDAKRKIINDKCKNVNSAINEKTKHKQVTDGKDGSNVNIISQVILQGGSKDISAVNATKSQAQGSKSGENKEKPPIVVPKLDVRKRESRVPRNLTEELNINLDRSKKRQDYITQIINSSEKKTDSRMTYQLSPAHRYGLSDDGEIPKLKLFSDPDCSEVLSNDTNPVTEFQIFKTNLPCLEKSNSLSSISVQIQTPCKDGGENSQKKCAEIMSESKIAVSKGESLEHHSNDVCTMNLDMLNMDIRQCKAEDFPNLVAHSESNDKHNLPLEPLQKKFASTGKQTTTELGNKNDTINPLDVDKTPMDLSKKSTNRSSKVPTSKAIEKRETRNTAQHKQISVDVVNQNTPQEDTNKNEHHHVSTVCNDISTNDDEAEEDLYLSYRSDPTYSYKLITPIKDHTPIHSKEKSKEKISGTPKPSITKTLTSPAKIHIHTASDTKENTVMPCQRKEKLKPPLIDDVEALSKREEIEGGDEKNHIETSTKLIINKGTFRKEDSSRSTMCSNSKGPSMISTEKNTKSAPKKCLNSKRTVSKGTIDAQDTSNATTQVDGKIEAQNTSLQPKVSEQLIKSHLAQSNSNTKAEEKCISKTTIIDNTTTKNNVQKKSLPPKEMENKANNTNTNNGTVDVSSSLPKVPIDNKMEADKTPSNRTDSTETSLNRSTENKSSTRSIDRRKRRCAIKLV